MSATTQSLPWKRMTLEGGVIVFSILLAFAIDASWANYEIRKEESETLTALRAEFAANLEQLDSVVAVRNEAKFGTWNLNPARSKLNGPPPRTETRVYENRGTGVTLSTRSGVNARGEPFFSQYASKVDGKDYPRVVKGSEAVSSIALVVIDARSEAWTVKVDGEVTITGTSVISEDGLTLTTTTHGRSESVSVYDKQ